MNKTYKPDVWKVLEEMFFSSGAIQILEERIRQKEVEGWTAEHDDEHAKGEMATAALCYLLEQENEQDDPLWWPWDWEWWKPKDRISNLVRAGALIAAEIDRLKRLQGKNLEVDDG